MVDEVMFRRLMARVTLSPGTLNSDCWLFTGPLTTNGYARLSTGRYSAIAAHRLAYEQLIGPIPDGLEIDHLCRVRNCVNPEHLQPVTHAENVRRSYLFNKRPIKALCLHGHERLLTPSGRGACPTCKMQWQRDHRERAAAHRRLKRLNKVAR